MLCALRHRFKGEPLYPLFGSLITTSYVDNEGNLKTSLKLEAKYEHAGELIDRIVEIDADPDTTRAKIIAAGIPHFGSLENLLNVHSTIHAYLDNNYKDIGTLPVSYTHLTLPTILRV